MSGQPLDDWNGFYNALYNSGESPRARAMIAAAFLDAHLRDLLAKFLINNKKAVDALLGPEDQDGREYPLSTFGARIRAAYCLGLISKDEHDDLNLIRRIRNRCAHRLHVFSFDDEEIVNWCNSLQNPKKLEQDWLKSHRDLFLVGVTAVAVQLTLRASQFEQQRRTVPRDFKVVKIVK